MTKKQEKIALIAEILYSIIWAGAIIGAFVTLGGTGWLIALIILNLVWLIATFWLVLFSSATDKVAGIAICILLAGALLGGIANNYSNLVLIIF